MFLFACLCFFRNPLSANFTKRSDKLKQFVGNLLKSSIQKIAQFIQKAVKTVAELCISDAAKEIKTINSANDTFIFDNSTSDDGA